MGRQDLPFPEPASDIVIMTEQQKRPRGAPRLIPIEGLLELRTLRPDVHTDRQLQNIALANQAMRILGLMPPENSTPTPTWLVDWEGADRGKQGAIKWAILEQLGRMALAGFGEGFIRPIAAALEQRRPSVKEGAAWLRAVRLSELRKARAAVSAT
jgi:hypothetical protein